MITNQVRIKGRCGNGPVLLRLCIKGAHSINNLLNCWKRHKISQKQFMQAYTTVKYCILFLYYVGLFMITFNVLQYLENILNNLIGVSEEYF